MNNVTLSIIGNGIPELALLEKEVAAIATTNNIAILKDVAKKTNKRFEKTIELSDKAELHVFTKIVQLQHERFLCFSRFLCRLPNKITSTQKTKILLMYKIYNPNDITQIIALYIELQKEINQYLIKQQLPKAQSLKDLFADDDDADIIRQHIEANYDEENVVEPPKPYNDELERIIQEKYVWQEGVGPVPKSMLRSPIPIYIPGEEKRKKK